MATVTALADRVCAITGLQSTGTERALVVAALNNVYVKAIERSGSYRGTATENLTSGTSDYDIVSSSGANFGITDMLQVLNVTATGGGVTDLRMKRVSEGELLEMRENNTSTGPLAYYAIAGDNLMRLWPTPGSGCTVTFSYVKTPPTLVESGPGAGEESTPSKIPARWHYDLLSTGAVVEALEKDQRVEDVNFWMQKWEKNLLEYCEYVQRFGGESDAFNVGGVDVNRYPGQRHFLG